MRAWRGSITRLVLAILLAAALASPAAGQAPGNAEASAIFDAAVDESRRACASPRARELFLRAEKLGKSYAALYHAWTYDPQRCKAPETDPLKAAALYHALADSREPGAHIAVEAWIRLWSKGLHHPRRSRAPPPPSDTMARPSWMELMMRRSSS
jgi:hypothetical protein